MNLFRFLQFTVKSIMGIVHSMLFFQASPPLNNRFFFSYVFPPPIFLTVKAGLFPTRYSGSPPPPPPEALCEIFKLSMPFDDALSQQIPHDGETFERFAPPNSSQLTLEGVKLNFAI